MRQMIPYGTCSVCGQDQPIQKNHHYWTDPPAAEWVVRTHLREGQKCQGSGGTPLSFQPPPGLEGDTAWTTIATQYWDGQQARFTEHFGAPREEVLAILDGQIQTALTELEQERSAELLDEADRWDRARGEPSVLVPSDTHEYPWDSENHWPDAEDRDR